MDMISDIASLFIYLHVSIIHFPIVTFLFACLFGLISYILVLYKNRKGTSDLQRERIEKSLPFLEFVSVINLALGLISIPIVALAGLIDARSLDNAVYTDFLAFKIQLTIITTFVLLSAFIFKMHLHKNIKIPIFKESKTIPLFYLFPLFLGTFMILIIAGEGGRYVFGHTVFDNVGLGFLVPKAFDYSFYYGSNILSFPQNLLVGPVGLIILIIVFFGVLIYPFKKMKSSTSNQ